MKNLKNIMLSEKSLPQESMRCTIPCRNSPEKANLKRQESMLPRTRGWCGASSADSQERNFQVMDYGDVAQFSKLEEPFPLPFGASRPRASLPTP